MAAPKGNQFWKLRSKHGRDKLFATPQLLWDACIEYFEWCDSNPLLEATIQKRKVSRDEEKIEMHNLPKMRAYTIQGLCLYLDCNVLYFNQFEKALEGKNDTLSKDFSKIVTRVRETIYNQKFTGAASGFLNASIIARDLGLAEKTESKVTVEQPLFDDDDDEG